MRAMMLSLAMLGTLPGMLAAQACIGRPTADGQFAVGGGFSVTEGAKAYGVDGDANLVGPVTVQANLGLVTYDDVDPNGTSFGAGVATEIPSFSFSACPTAGIEYTRVSESGSAFGVEYEADVSTTVIPVGFGVGTSFPASPSLTLTPYAIPQFLYVRSSVSASGAGESASESASSSEFGGVVGLVLGGQRAFVGGSVGFTTMENSDPTFSLGLGLVVR